jgi:hypothetical protein
VPDQTEKRTVIRGGAGLFYDSWPWSVHERSHLYDGLQLSEVVIANPSYPDPYSSGQSITGPPSVVRLAPDIATPSFVQTSIDVEREVWRKNWITAEYTFLDGSHLLRSRNINAPLPGTAWRPTPDFLNINQIESSAFQRSHAMTVTWRGHLKKIFEPYAQYVFSRTTNDTSGPFSLPANNYDLRLERGPADFDWRHRFNLIGSLMLPGGFQSGLIVSALSGTPFNVTTGSDDNGDTVVNDRPPGVFRNSRRGPATVQLDVRLAKGVSIAKAGDERSKRRDRLNFTFDLFNVLNTTNISNMVGVLSSPFFGRGNSAAQPRSAQLSIQYSFRR